MRRFVKVMAPILVMVGIMGTTPALVGADNGNHYGQNGGNNGNQNNQNGVHNNNGIIPIPEPPRCCWLGAGWSGWPDWSSTAGGG